MTESTNALLITVDDPFNVYKSRKLARIPVGRTIFEILTENGYISMTANGIARHGYFFVTVNGDAVLQADWNTMIRDEDCLAVWALPQGGGGGSNIGVILITVVMVAAAVFTGGATLGVALAWGAAAGAAVGLLSSLAPTPAAASSGSNIGKDSASSTYTISAQTNSARIGEAIPNQYGRMRVFPDLGAQPYTESRGNALYLYQLMVVGQGKYEIERIQIEDSDINAYGEVEYEIIPPGRSVTLFPDNVITSEAVQGLELLAPDEENYSILGPFVTSPPGVKTNFTAVDIQLPQGAYTVDDDGNNRPSSVEVTFQERPISDTGVPLGPYVTIVSEKLTYSTKTAQMLTYKVEHAEGRYEVVGVRSTPKPADNRTVNKVIWTGLKGYAKSARTFGNVTMIATIIKATNNLNSNTSRRINLIATRMLQTWDPVNGWGPEVATSSPAWAYADAVRNSEYGPGWGTNRINMAELYRLAQVWKARGDEFNGVYDTTTTLWQALGQIAAVGRATPAYYAGMIDIVRDEPKAIPALMFTPGQILENTFKGSYKLGTKQTPDHVIIKFWNRETWQEDQVTCVLPGSTTKVPATKELFGITDHDHAWREGMYAAAVNRDQRSRNTFTTEMEGVLLRFGDLIHVSHDVPGWGTPGKVLSFNPLSGKVVTSEPMPFTDAPVHYITFRKKNGKADGPWPVVADPNPVAGVNSAIVQGTPAKRQAIFISQGVAVDLTAYVFGPADRESAKLVVLNAKPNSKGQTQVTVCDYVTSTHIADQGGDVPIPPPISNLPGAPVGPIVNSVRVELTTEVGLQQIIADPAVGATHYEFEGRIADGGNWAAFGISGDPFMFVNLDSARWSIRVRGVGAIPGPWATWEGDIAATSLPLARLSALRAETQLFAIKLSVEVEEESRSIAKTIEIWASRTNVIGNATLLVKLPYPTSNYVHTGLLAGDRFFYYGRVIDSAGRVGPWFNNSQGVNGIASTEAAPILEQIADSLTKDQLGKELLSEIELITAPTEIVGSVNSRINQVREVLAGDIDRLGTSVTDLSSDVNEINGEVDAINQQLSVIQSAGLYDPKKTYASGKSTRGTDDHLYVAKTNVPVNTPPPNTTYWLDVGQVAINENGSASRITTVETRVTKTETSITSQASLINGLRTDVDGKASQSAMTAITSRVSTAEGKIDSQGQSITNLQSSVANKADSSAVTALTTRVTAAENSITSQGNRVTSLENSVNNSTTGLASKASATSVDALTNRVSSAEGTLSGQAQSITNLNTNLTTTNSNVTAAQTAANNAATLAGSKGKVIVQTAAPAAADQLAQNLWIDITNGANTPKRWNGSAWAPVTDKVATDAANAAATALTQIQTKADATAVTALTGRVTAAETGITSLSSNITSLSNNLSNAGGENLFYNPSFSKYPSLNGSPEGWETEGSVTTTDTLVTSWLNSGEKAQRIVANGLNNSGQYKSLRPVAAKRIKVGSNQQVTASAFARKNDSDVGMRIFIQWLNTAGVVISAPNSPLVALTIAGERQSFSAVAPSGAAEAYVYFRLYGMTSTAINATVEIARPQAEYGAIATGWKDNNQVNASDILATSTAVTSLTSKVEQQGAALTSASQSITDLSNSVGSLGAENLIYNPSFEKKTPGSSTLADGWTWTGAGGTTRTPSLVTSQLEPSGLAQRLDVTGFARNLWVRIQPIDARRVSVAPGQTLTFSIYMRATAGLIIRAEFYFRKADASAISGPAGVLGTSVTANGSFQRVDVTAVVPADAGICEFYPVTFGTDSISSGFVEMDRAQLEQSARATGWRDNSQVLQANQSATSTALDALTSTVTQQGTTLTSVAGRTTALESTVNSTTNGLATKASASAVNDLSTRVTNAEGVLSTNSADITVLKSAIGSAGSFVAGAPFEFINSNQGWLPQTSGATMTPGPLFSTVNKYTTLQRNGLAINGSENPFVRFRFKRKNTSRTQGAMYWANQDGGLAEARRANFTITGSEDWQDIEIDLSTNTGWYGKTINAVRLDFMNTNDASAILDIAYFAAGRRSAAASAQAVSGLTTTVTSQGSTIDAQGKTIADQGNKLTAQATQLTNLSAYVGNVASTLNNETTARVNSDQALSQRIDTTQSSVGDLSASVQQTSTAIANTNGALNAQYSVKVMLRSSGEAVVAGFGFGLSDQNGVFQSQFIVSADRFAVLNANLSGSGVATSPFAIVNGQVFINDAFIQKATIQNALIGSTISSQTLSNFGEPIMRTDYANGQIIIVNKTTQGAYMIIRQDGIFMVQNGVTIVELSIG